MKRLPDLTNRHLVAAAVIIAALSSASHSPAQSPPEIHILPVFVTFGSIPIGSSTAATFAIENHGEFDLEVSAIDLAPGIDFSLEYGGLVGRCPNSTPVIAGGERCLVLVRFAPTAVGLLEETVTITSNGSVDPTIVPLKGTGTPALYPEIEVDRALVNFGDVAVGEEATEEIITISNLSSTDTLRLGEIVLSNTVDFSFDEYGGSSPCGLGGFVPPGSSCTISVTFAPTTNDPMRETLSISSNDQDDPTVVVDLIGNGGEVLLEDCDNQIDDDEDGLVDCDDPECATHPPCRDSDGDGVSDVEEGGPCCTDPIPPCPDRDDWDEDPLCEVETRDVKHCDEGLSETQCEDCNPGGYLEIDQYCYWRNQDFVDCYESLCTCPFEVIEQWNPGHFRVLSLELGEQIRSCDSDDVHDAQAASLWTYDRHQYVTIEAHYAQGVPGDWVILEDVRAMDPADYGVSPEEAPYGFFSFTLRDWHESKAGDYEVWIRLPEFWADNEDLYSSDRDYRVPGVDGYKKFGPTPDDPTPHLYGFWQDWENIGHYERTDPLYVWTLVGASYNRPSDVELRGLGDTIVLRFKEGRIGDRPPGEGPNEYPGDHDLEINGIIVDPGGPVVATDGGGGGCSCRVHVPRKAAGNGLLAGIVALFLLRRRRRKI